MSQVQGFAVDGNRQPILGINGKPIEVPKDAPLPAQFDEKTGQLITFTQNKNGTIVGTATKVQGYTPTPTTPVKPNIIETAQGLYDADKKEWIK